MRIYEPSLLAQGGFKVAFVNYQIYLKIRRFA